MRFDQLTGINWRAVDEQMGIRLRSMERWDGAAPHGLTGLREASVLASVADARLRAAVGSARVAGATWASIGAAIGITKQAAQQRYRATS